MRKRDVIYTVDEKCTQRAVLLTECLSEEETSVAAARKPSTSLRRCSVRAKAGINPVFCAVSIKVLTFKRFHLTSNVWGMETTKKNKDVPLWNAEYLASEQERESAGFLLTELGPYLDPVGTCDKGLVFLIWQRKVRTPPPPSSTDKYLSEPAQPIVGMLFSSFKCHP